MAAMAALSAIFATYFLLIVAYAVVWIIANWRIYTKAGEPGWKSIIPIYNIYTLYKIVWKPSMFWMMVVLEVAASIMSAIAGDSAMIMSVGSILGLLGGLVGLIQTHKESVAFGHGIGFTLGLIFLNPIFVLILAFGSSKYEGPQN